jgi:DNA-directed RNA polymerase subunit RPC12/RpoP
MSEFKFACPVCGQHIKCEPDEAGTQLECPTCFQKVIVPQAPSDGSKFVLTGSQRQARPMPLAGAPDAHANPAPSSNGMSTTAAIVVVLICVAAGVLVAFRGKLFRSGSKPVAITNAPSLRTNVIAQVPPVTNTSSSDPWTLDLTNATFPSTIAAGRIHGTNFTCDRAVLQGGTLTLRAGNAVGSYVGLNIAFSVRRSEDLAGLRVDITTNAPFVPRVMMRSTDNEQTVNEVVRGGYAMKLNFGKVVGGRIPGKIYICLPDEAKSYVAGTFQAEILRPAPPNQKTR